MTPFAGKRSILLSLFCLCLFFQVISAQDKNWRPITPQEMAMKTSTVEPNADSEAIFWEVKVDYNAADGMALEHYVRVKIFTDRGREQFSKRDIPFIKGTRIRDVDARVTKPDGSVAYLKKEDVLERDIVKTNGVKIKAKSFALPGLEVGSIVEYRYREVMDGISASMRLIFQRDIPIENVSYYVKPRSVEGYGMLYQAFNVGNTTFEKDKGDFLRATMKNVPALREEPDMMPEDEVRSWMYIYYTENTSPNAEAYWKDFSKRNYEFSKNAFKANDDIKRVAAEITGGAANDEEKLRKLYDYCKANIKNIDYLTGVSDDDRKKVRETKTAADVLKLKMSSGSDIDIVFGALAKASGFDARMAFSGDRSEMLFKPGIPNSDLMINSMSIAIKTGETWRLFSPSSYYMPFGMLAWNKQDQASLITDPKELIWFKIMPSRAEDSSEKRSGKFRLTEDGTLEGEASIEFTGQRAASQKSYNDGDSAPVREATLKKIIRSNILGSAEVQDFTIQNVTDPEKPFIYKFKIRVPGYASRTGKRLFFQPDVFERSSKPQYEASARKYDIYVNYPWSEEDNVTIELPEGFSLESPDAPAKVKDPQGIGSDEVKMAISKDGKTLTYKRTFSFGNGGAIYFPVASYPAIKELFDAFDKANKHQLTLRQGTPLPPPAPKAN